MESYYHNLKSLYPEQAIVNLEYRLGTEASPGYPKQIEDIGLALEEIKKPRYGISQDYFLLGVSAGAHLAMLYGYKYDTPHSVKGICNTVGPADFTDPSLAGNEAFATALSFFIGPETYGQNPGLWEETSPARHITSRAPKTISFYGSEDPLVPPTQMDLLHGALDTAGVYNEKTMYTGEGHGGWNPGNTADYSARLIHFIDQHFIGN